jgi:hypothetical protein
MSNNIYWGQAVNNDIDWGQGSTNNNISWGIVYDDSYSGETLLEIELMQSISVDSILYTSDNGIITSDSI